MPARPAFFALQQAYRWPLLIVLLLAFQITFAIHAKKHLPDLGIVPPLPSQAERHSLALGDAQWLFRLYSFRLQQSGDTFGRSTALYRYDYPLLKQWFLALDTLDNRSHLIPTLASYYFAQSQNPEHTRYVIDYLDAHTKDRINTRWWWAVQAAYLAKYRLKDEARALALAERLKDATSAPLWVRQYPAFLYEQAGEFDHALNIIETIVNSAPDLDEKDLKFMQYFVKERLQKLEESKALFAQ